jgi:hypothetical protein
MLAPRLSRPADAEPQKHRIPILSGPRPLRGRRGLTHAPSGRTETWRRPRALLG